MSDAFSEADLPQKGQQVSQSRAASRHAARRIPRLDKARSSLFEHWQRYVPETVLLIGAMTIVDAMYFGGHRFQDVQPHPFWLPILLVAVQYGIGGGAFAALCATAALYTGALPPRGEDIEFYSYLGSLAGQPAAWLMTASMLGALRTVHIWRETSLTTTLRESEDRAMAIADGLRRSLREIDRLEHRIAADTATVDGLLRGLGQANMKNAHAFAGSMNGLVHDLLGAASFTVYLRTQAGLEAAVTEDEEADITGHRPVIPKEAPLIRLLEAPGRVIERSNDLPGEHLPAGALAVVSLFSQRTARLHGVLVVERLRLTERPVAGFADRLSALALALTAILDGIPASSAASRDLSEVRPDKISA